MSLPVATLPANHKPSMGPALVATQIGSDWVSKPGAPALHQLSDTIQLVETELGHWESEFRQFSRTLIAMQEMERKRIASDLHDSIGQSLCALSFGINAALAGISSGNSRMAGQILEKLASQVKETIVEVQHIAMNLRPAMLDDIGLVATLTWFFREFQLIHPGLAMSTHIDIEEGDVAPALRTSIFRVIQEAVNNIVKHACASEIRIVFRRTEREVHLEVIDDGIGFVVNEGAARAVVTGSRMGLKGMRERAECSGGRFCLVSIPGKGTRVFVTWPIPE